jgi:hypothetical protein
METPGKKIRILNLIGEKKILRFKFSAKRFCPMRNGLCFKSFSKTRMNSSYAEYRPRELPLAPSDFIAVGPPRGSEDLEDPAPRPAVFRRRL